MNDVEQTTVSPGGHIDFLHSLHIRHPPMSGCVIKHKLLLLLLLVVVVVVVVLVVVVMLLVVVVLQYNILPHDNPESYF